VHEVTGATGLDGEAVRNVRVLERFSLLEVPADDVERITSALKDRRLEVEPARN
jgi:ATP-dependent RNA helicase DeaD